MPRPAKVWLHLAIICVVLLAPPLIYDAISRTSLQKGNGFEFAGGLLYPAYFCYWLLQLRSTRAKCILGFTLGLLTVSAIILGTSDRATPLILLLFPAIIGAAPIALSVVAGIMRNKAMAITWLFTSLIALPLGVSISVLATYGAAMSSLGNMRY